MEGICRAAISKQTLVSRHCVREEDVQMWHRQWYAITLEPSTVLLSLPPCNGRINAAMHNAPCTPTAPRGWLQGGAVGRLRHRQRCYLLPPYTCLTVPRFVLLLGRSHLDRRSTELAKPTRFTSAVLTPQCGRWPSACVSVVARPYPPGC
jgi:hypothetical protein